LIFAAVPWEERAICSKGRRRAIELQLILRFGPFQLFWLALVVVLEVYAAEIQVGGLERTGVFWLDHYQLL
jgi:hypothetical protein